MKNTLLFLVCFITLSNYSFSNTHFSLKDIKTLYFDVVEKELFLDNTFNSDISVSIKTIFDNKIKVNGFEGIIKISLFEFKEVITTTDKSKRVDLSIKFNKEIISQKYQKKRNQYYGEVNSYGTIDGRFSINDFEKMTEEVQWELIKRLFNELNS